MRLSSSLPHHPRRHAAIILHDRRLQRIHQHGIHLLRKSQGIASFTRYHFEPSPITNTFPRTRSKFIPIREPNRQNSIPPGFNTRQSERSESLP
jgi:hypothetical protein